MTTSIAARRACLAVLGLALAAATIIVPNVDQFVPDTDPSEGAAFDAERTSAAFSERLRNQVDLATVAVDLDGTVRASIAPTSVGVWLRTQVVGR